MHEKLLRDTQQAFGRLGPTHQIFKQHLKQLHREFTVRRQLFGEDSLSPLFRQIGQFLNLLRALRHLADLPIKYDIRLSDDELADVRAGKFIPASKFGDHRKRKKGKKKRPPVEKRWRRVIVPGGGTETNRRRH